MPLAPNTLTPELFDIEVFNPTYTSSQPHGPYIEADFEWQWAVPGTGVFKIMADHPMAATYLMCRRRVIPIRTYHNGKAWDGRVMSVVIEGEPGKEIITVTCMSNLFWLLTVLAWVNPLFPPEVQVGITGKQDIMFGPIDFVFKYFLSKNVSRQGKPIHMGLPLVSHQNQPDLKDIDSIDDLLEMVNGIDLIALSARFTQIDELYRQTIKNGDIGLSMDLWVKGDSAQSPEVFRSSTLATLSTILTFGSDNFLNFKNLNNELGITDPSQWNRVPGQAGYIFNTRRKRDRSWQIWSTDSGQILSYRRSVAHPVATRSVVGGQAPQILNQVIEFAANLVLQAIAGAITALFGLPGIGGLAVGNLFDDIFFAFQVVVDYDLEAELGIHGFSESFADNTSAWSLDSFAVGLNDLLEKGGSDDVELTVISGGPDGRGFQFGVDNGSGRRYDVGDIMTFHDRGVYIPRYVSSVRVTDKRDGRKLETVTLGDNEKLLGAWGLVIDRIKSFAALSRGIAVQG